MNKARFFCHSFQRPAVAAYLSLGSNMGDRQRFLSVATSLIAAHPDIALEYVSSLYETDPVGYEAQADFYNAAVRIRTTLPPCTLLRFCQSVEHLLGRRRTQRWGPRTLDIDILCYGRLTLQTKHLTLPHPRIAERDFVLIPLREIMTGIGLPTASVRLVKRDWYKSTCLGEEKAIK